ncbi:glycosyltransferase [Vibrio mexicanus]|uniref:glycosyltransferase family 2 protein n=1 Tax=Vibrio mexicanus TaxID=1004326 RepID=UPI001EE1F980
MVINDCSPEPELTVRLRELSQVLPFTLIENKSNLGFVQTVNKGMRISNKNDVLLLNSDTVVTSYWLDRILETAASDSSIGTVTPFSNNATICSYPRFCADNELPSSATLEELAAVVSQNEGIVDLPTAHGFAMFIKREALDEVGLFDDQKWGKGYAEENDFSLRASRLGWRNVMATNAFVHHLGSVSFAEDSESFIAKNLQKLNGIYPDYSLSVQRFIAEDPIRLHRNNIALSLMESEVSKLENLTDEYQGSYLFASLSIGGGTGLLQMIYLSYISKISVLYLCWCALEKIAGNSGVKLIIVWLNTTFLKSENL